MSNMFVVIQNLLLSSPILTYPVQATLLGGELDRRRLRVGDEVMRATMQGYVLKDVGVSWRRLLVLRKNAKAPSKSLRSCTLLPLVLVDVPRVGDTEALDSALKIIGALHSPRLP
jgi:hypothetical protein